MYKQKAPTATSHKDPLRYKADRIAPDRRWFGNTRVVGQKDLHNFREELGKKIDDSYSVVLKSKTLPLGLLADHKKRSRASLLEVESNSEQLHPNPHPNPKFPTPNPNWRWRATLKPSLKEGDKKDPN